MFYGPGPQAGYSYVEEWFLPHLIRLGAQARDTKIAKVTCHGVSEVTQQHTDVDLTSLSTNVYNIYSSVASKDPRTNCRFLGHLGHAPQCLPTGWVSGGPSTKPSDDVCRFFQSVPCPCPVSSVAWGSAYSTQHSQEQSGFAQHGGSPKTCNQTGSAPGFPTKIKRMVYSPIYPDLPPFHGCVVVFSIATMTFQSSEVGQYPPFQTPHVIRWGCHNCPLRCTWRWGLLRSRIYGSRRYKPQTLVHLI